MSIQYQLMSISSSSSMSITLKTGASTIFSGKILKGSLWSSSSLKSRTWLSNNALPVSNFSQSQSILTAINNKDKSAWLHRICHQLCWNFFPRFDYPLYRKSYNWFHVCRSCIFMFCISELVVIPFLDSFFERSIPNHIRC